jgi:predicted SnoaL-like aldol condensation-catalyzing enzyme
VLNSALGSGDYAKSFPNWHRVVEEKLKTSGIGFTILRPNSFMQNILAYMAPSIRAQNAFYSAMADAKTSYLDVRDIAAVAVNALLHPEDHAGRIYELNGPEAVTSDQLAQRISAVAGRQISYVAIPESVQQKAMLDLGMPAWQVTALMELQQYYTGGKGGEVTDVLHRLLGREPIRLDAFLAEFKSSFEPLNAKTGMTHSEMKQFVLNHFEEFVNRKNLDIADVNFAPGFVDHGTDVPPGTPPGPAGAKEYVGGAYKLFPDIRVQIMDMIAEDDKVVVRNQWTGTHASNGTKLEFSGIVIWRIEKRQLIERWAYLTPPQQVKK